MHARGASCAEQIAGTAGYSQFLAFSFAGIHTHYHFLFSYPGSVRLQVVLKDFYHCGFFKSLSLSGDKLCFFYLIDFNCKNYKYNTNKK